VQCAPARTRYSAQDLPTLVAEFVKHMNPLNVLRGRSLMDAMTPGPALRHTDNEVASRYAAGAHFAYQLDAGGVGNAT